MARSGAGATIYWMNLAPASLLTTRRSLRRRPGPSRLPTGDARTRLSRRRCLARPQRRHRLCPGTGRRGGLRHPDLLLGPWRRRADRHLEGGRDRPDLLAERTPDRLRAPQAGRPGRHLGDGPERQQPAGGGRERPNRASALLFPQWSSARLQHLRRRQRMGCVLGSARRQRLAATGTRRKRSSHLP